MMPTKRGAEMAETSGYFQAAYIVAGVLYVGYVLSLLARRRAARARLAAMSHAGLRDDANSAGRHG